MSTVHVAIPIYHRPEVVMVALETLALSDFGGHAVSLGLAINGAEPEFLMWLRNWGARSTFAPFVNAHVYLSVTRNADVQKRKPKNLGKPHAVNRCLEQLRIEHGVPDFVLSLDSDLRPLDLDWLPEMVRAFESWEFLRLSAEARLGALSADQHGNSGHFLGELALARSNRHVGGYVFSTALNNHGIAGGCLLVPNSVWTEIGGYRARKIHGDDDGPLMLDLAKKGYTAAVLEDVRFFHPPDLDPGYLAWKLRALAGAMMPEEADGYRFRETEEAPLSEGAH